MNYLLHFNGEVPNYAEICMQTINNIDPDSKIYFITDQDFKSKYSQNINSNDITFQYIKELKEIDYFEGEQNPLWNTSLLRIFHLHNASKLLKIDSFVHFDLDVLIFKAFNIFKFALGTILWISSKVKFSKEVIFFSANKTILPVK